MMERPVAPLKFGGRTVVLRYSNARAYDKAHPDQASTAKARCAAGVPLGTTPAHLLDSASTVEMAGQSVNFSFFFVTL